VGDKYILEGMQVSGAGLGGEKSGHVIVREHTTSGDGLVTALEVLRVITTSGRTPRRARRAIPLLPQEQRAVPVRHKEQWEGDPVLQRAIADAEARLGSDGRVLVRPSGTEPALRVMVEGGRCRARRELADRLSALAEAAPTLTRYVRDRRLHGSTRGRPDPHGGPPRLEYRAMTRPGSRSSTTRATCSWRSGRAS
jgi:phosphoglucosamine mutase